MRVFIFKPGIVNKELNEYIKSLPVDKSEYIITVKKNRAIRSISQNKYYHFACQIVATHTGHTHEEIHEIAKLKFNSKLINLPQSGSQIVGQSTSTLNTLEFTAFVNRFCKWALEEFEIVIPQPGDLDLIKRMEIENLYEKVQSGW